MWKKILKWTFGTLGILLLTGVVSACATRNMPTANTTDSSETTSQENQPTPESTSTDGETSPTTAQPQNGSVKVASVVDGDTIKVSINNKTETVRLIGIDTPETVDPREPVQCFGKEASNKAKSILTGKKVILEADSTQGERDKYNRLLRYVFLEDGTHFNKYMIAEGYAHEYTYAAPYKYQKEFKAAEKQAREQGKGLWGSGTCNGDTSKAAGSTAPPTSSIAPSNTTPPAAPSDPDSSGPQVKKSSSGICHEKGASQYYNQTKTYTPYDSIEACLASGGRLPR